MASRKSSLRARATSIFRSPLGTIHQGQLHDPTQEKADSQLNEKHDGVERLRSSSSGGFTHRSASSNALANDREAQRLVRSVPAWVHTREDIENQLLPDVPPSFPAPSDALIAQHNSNPSSQRRETISSRHSASEEQEWIPPWPGATIADTTSRWKAFKSATEYPHLSPNGGRIVSAEWWRENGPDYDQPWLADREDSEDGSMIYKHGIRRKAWYQRFERKILRSPIVPMVIRMTVMSFSAVALALASSIHHMTDKLEIGKTGQNPSTDMAIIVDAIAIVYLFYITYDEYSGKPLGLRSARAKLRLIFLDLFFIVFESANLSLAFVATRNNECEVKQEDGTDKACESTVKANFGEMLERQRALASVLLIALIAWLLTFAISITR